METNAIKDNGSGYEHFEVRNGPPLSYVAEKLRSSLESLHGIVRHMSDDPPLPRGQQPDDRTALRWRAESSFYHALVAYLALANRLAETHRDPDLADRLAGLTNHEFSKWLDRIDRSSSVRG